MRAIVYARGGGIVSKNELSEFLRIARESELECTFNAPFAEDIRRELGVDVARYNTIAEACGDVVISYGGDGTFLQAVAMMEECSIPILGINNGRLGFLANVSKEAIREAFKHLKNNDFAIEERTVIAVQGQWSEPMSHPYAFNEFSIQKEGMNMIGVDVSINGELVATYMADGVMISTPSGSTAYSLSVGGPIISPDCECFLICPIAPHNLNMRPLVVSSANTFTLKVETRNPSCIATLDNRVTKVQNKATFTVRRASQSVKLIKLPEISFYKTLRKKLLWGIDARDKIK